MANKIIVYRPTRERGDCYAYAFAEDGHILAAHCSSDYCWFQNDMGLSCREDGTAKTGIGKQKHELYRAKYPNGYELEEYVGDPVEHPVLSTFER